MMILVIDIGNSQCRFAVFTQTKLLQRTEFAVKDWRKGLQKIKLPAIEKAILISVNDPILLQICKSLKKMGKPYEVLGKPDYHLACKDKSLLKNLGADRAANILGGKHFKQNNFIAIDCGTAITIDYCNKQGQFCGGVILSGRQLMAQALYDHTDKLPLLTASKIKPPRSVLGKNTLEAINSGLTYGVAAMVDGIILRMSKLSKPKPSLLVCGGGAEDFAKLSSHRVILQKDLTLWGGLCYARNRG